MKPSLNNMKTLVKKKKSARAQDGSGTMILNNIIKTNFSINRSTLPRENLNFFKIPPKMDPDFLF